MGGEHNGVLYPLDAFYAADKLPLPPWEQIAGEAMPQPYRQLLVHNGDMTPALENFHGKPIHLKLLNSRREGDHYMREVVLLLNGIRKPVEFGAISINLALFDAQSQQDILAGSRPLGTIMHRQDVRHSSRPSGFMKMQADALIAECFNLPQGTTVYARRNTLLTSKNESLAEIVEILPP
jgi:chorismate-pyruvate lyase